MDETSQKLGLLIETAEASQQLATALLQKLEQHTRGLDGIVRQEIRRTLLEELREVHTESQRAAEALRRLQRTATRRRALFSIGLMLLSTAAPLAIALGWLPSPSQIARLTAERADLESNLALLREHGARAALSPCGDHHLCVRVDLKQARYGEQSDFLVIHGY